MVLRVGTTFFIGLYSAQFSEQSRNPPPDTIGENQKHRPNCGQHGKHDLKKSPAGWITVGVRRNAQKEKWNREQNSVAPTHQQYYIG